MRPQSRTGLILLLTGVEVAIAGFALVVTRGHHGFSASAAGLHRLSYAGRTYAPIDAGARPHVFVSDPNSRVSVVASNDGLVHVTDGTSTSGIIYGTAPIAEETVERTPDGVSVRRPSDNANYFSFGFLERRVRIAVPPGASLEIAKCSGADVSDLRGAVNVQSQDGRLTFSDISPASLVAMTSDGSIRASGLQLAGNAANARIQTQDGSVSLHFADAGNLTVRARTSDGHIVVNGRSTHSDDDSVEETSTLGNGAGSLDVSTQDGTITMTTNGVQ